MDRKTGYRTRCLLTVPLVGTDGGLVGVMQVLNKLDGVFDTIDERIAEALASQCAVALQRAVLIEEQLVKEKLERDLDIARDIQMKLLPKQMPAIAGYDIAGFSRPADQTGRGRVRRDGPGRERGDAAAVRRDGARRRAGHPSVSQVRAMMRMAMRLDADFDDAFPPRQRSALPGTSRRTVSSRRSSVCSTRKSISITYHSGRTGAAACITTRDTDTCTRYEASTFPLGHRGGARPRAASNRSTWNPATSSR